MSAEFLILMALCLSPAIARFAIMGFEIAREVKDSRESAIFYAEEQRLRDKYPYSGPPEGCRYGLAPDCYGIGDYRIRDYETGKDVRVRAMHNEALRDAEALNNGTQDFEISEVKSLMEIIRA